MINTDLQELLALMETPEFIEEVKVRLEAERATWPECQWCGNVYHPSLGYGDQCLTCASRPTSECMGIVINI